MALSQLKYKNKKTAKLKKNLCSFSQKLATMVTINNSAIAKS